MPALLAVYGVSKMCLYVCIRRSHKANKWNAQIFSDDDKLNAWHIAETDNGLQTGIDTRNRRKQWCIVYWLLTTRLLMCVIHLPSVLEDATSCLAIWLSSIVSFQVSASASYNGFDRHQQLSQWVWLVFSDACYKYGFNDDSLFNISQQSALAFALCLIKANEQSTQKNQYRYIIIIWIECRWYPHSLPLH
jgi:hypothetical protein